MQPQVLQLESQAETAGISQTDIAFHSGKKISQSTVCRIFGGRQEASPQEVEAIAEGLRAAIRAKAERLRRVMPEAFIGAPA